MERTRTIVDIKAAFLRAQVRLLTAALQPSAQWRDFCPETDEGDLSERVVNAAMSKVNEKIKQHNRIVYSAQLQRHVAEQIDTLYWNVVSREDARVPLGTTTVKNNIDLTIAEGLESLPADYETLFLQADQETDEVDRERYYRLRLRLEDLIKQRDQQKTRLAQYRALQEMLRPFENAQENVQPNIVTKDGELAKELERMRVLLARVTGRAADMNGTSHDSNQEGTGTLSNEQKLADVMALT